MSQSIFPLLIVDTFIPSLWTLQSTTLTREYADLHYVKFPIAQGSETFPLNLTVTGTTNLGETFLQTKNSIQSTTHYLNFSDSSATGVGQIQKSANLSVVPSTGSLTTSGLVTATGGLTIGGANNITLGSGATAPTAGTQLGGATTGTFNTPLSAFSAEKVIATLTIPQSGTYIIFFSFQIFYTTLPSTSFISVNTGSSGGTPNIGYSPTVVNSGQGLVNGSFPLIVPSSTVGTVQLKYFITGTIDKIEKTFFTAIRIA